MNKKDVKIIILVGEMAMKNDELQVILEQIAKIKPGDTFSASYNQPVQHNVWSTTATRTWYRESRQGTLTYLKHIFETALQCKVMIPMAKEAMQGLENLKYTYHNDSAIINDIDELITVVYKQLNQYNVDKHEFFVALEKNNQSFVEAYLYNGEESNLKNEDGQNALHVVSQKAYYNEALFKLLIHFKVDPLALDVDDKTPLYYAITTGCTDAVLKLE